MVCPAAGSCESEYSAVMTTFSLPTVYVEPLATGSPFTFSEVRVLPVCAAAVIVRTSPVRTEAPFGTAVPPRVTVTAAGIVIRYV